MICKRCNIPMVRVMSFEKGKSSDFYKCRKCYRESRHIPFSFAIKPIQNKYNSKTYVKNKTEQVRKET